jgi:hypothetical protein
MYFSRPYQTTNSYSQRVLQCVLFGFMVFLFLFVFKPFGLAELGDKLLIATIGYGAVTTTVMLFLNVALMPVMPAFFSEENWTVGRELLWTAVNILFIAFANVWFSVFMGFASWSWNAVFAFGLYTISLGVFPAALVIMINEARLKGKYESESSEISTQIDKHSHSENSLSNASVTITSENQGETFSIAPAALLFIRSADNYAEVYFEESGQVSRKVVRNSLKNLEASLNLPTMLRCHKSYLVNTNRINHVSGNAQGYKLHFKGTDLLIPVSRQMNDEVKNLFTGGH